MNKAHIDYLVTAGLRLAAQGPDRLAWTVPAKPEASGVYQRGAPWGPEYLEDIKERRRYLTLQTADRVGEMLWRENYRSFQHRYDEVPEVEARDPYVLRRFTRRIDPVQVLKAIECYTYQSCEHPEWPDSEAKAFCDALRWRAIDALPGYEEAEWEIRP